MEEGPRYTQVSRDKGHYESYYLKAACPGGGRAFWIRHTVHKRPGAEPTASIWFTYFDRDAEAPLAAKETFGADRLSAPPEGWVKVADSVIGPGRVDGSVDGGSTAAVWDLSFDASGEPCRYLPDFMYSAPLPKTKFVAPAPSTSFSGTVHIGGDRIELDAWPGMIGHNWGSEHAERWVWLEGTGFADDPTAYFDTGAARVMVGGRTLPWMAAGKVRLDGVTHDLGGPLRFRSTKINARPGRCDFLLPGKTATVRGRLSAPRESFVGWVYADPEGPDHNTINCSVCDLELTVERPGERSRTLHLPAAGAFELGMRETDHGIPIQPYSDG